MTKGFSDASPSTATVPGLQSSYQPPEHPDLVVNGDRESPDAAVRVAQHFSFFRL
jgi:adenylylsulfate kinase-like enzyme